MKTSEALIKARRLVAESWGQLGELGVNNKNCIVTAIHNVHDHVDYMSMAKACVVVNEAIESNPFYEHGKETIWDVARITQYNDAYGRTKEEVLDTLSKAIAIAQKRETGAENTLRNLSDRQEPIAA